MLSRAENLPMISAKNTECLKYLSSPTAEVTQHYTCRIFSRSYCMHYDWLLLS